jgi:hypothetical protein
MNILYTRLALEKVASGSGNTFGEKLHNIGEDLEKTKVHLDTPLRNVALGTMVAGAGAVTPKKLKSLRYGLMLGGGVLGARGIIRDSNNVTQKLKEFDARHAPTIIMNSNDAWPQEY